MLIRENSPVFVQNLTQAIYKYKIGKETGFWIKFLSYPVFP